jgi:integrase
MGHLLLQQALSQPKVSEFLDSYEMNSVKTKRNYGIGLGHFETFLDARYEGKHNLSTILEAFATKQINVYALLNQFVQYMFRLKGERKLSHSSINTYLTGIRSYLQNYDIEISTWKFKHKVRIPKTPKTEEEAIDASDIRKILKAVNNRRLKAYLLVLASSGLRAIEGITLRIKDFDFESKPTRVHVRPEFSKTRSERFVYISDEATEAVKQWIDFKYRKRNYKWIDLVKSPDDLVFTNKFRNQPKHTGIYIKIVQEFNRVLKIVGMDSRKDGMKRRRITLHSFRRYVYSTISDQAGKNYAEMWLGHVRSEYHVKKEVEKRDIYTACMKYLTFLDFEQLEATGKNIEAKLEEKDREIAHLRNRDTDKEDTINNLSDRLLSMDERMRQQEKMIQQLLRK